MSAMTKTTTMTDRARAWYDAAYRRLAAADAVWGQLDSQTYLYGDQHDVRAAIAARYARAASVRS